MGDSASAEAYGVALGDRAYVAWRGSALGDNASVLETAVLRLALMQLPIRLLGKLVL